MVDQLPSIGRIVHFVDENDLCRAAIITEVDEVQAEVTLRVFYPKTTAHRDHVGYDDSKTRGTWHWVERV